MGKWIAGVASAVVIAVLTFWLTHGFENLLTARPYSVTGVWDYTMRSNLDQRIHTGSLDLTMDGETVSGTMRMWDKTDSAVKGTFKADSLSFVRETGMQGTVQFFELKKVSDKGFAGTFRNEGSVPDNGTITIAR
jgi:hypothetical protein